MDFVCEETPTCLLVWQISKKSVPIHTGSKRRRILATNTKYYTICGFNFFYLFKNCIQILSCAKLEIDEQYFKL